MLTLWWWWLWQFYSVIRRVATVLKTRYTAPGFWLAGLGLFEEAECLISDIPEKEHLKTCILQAREHLHQVDNPLETSQNTSNGGRSKFYNLLLL